MKIRITNATQFPRAWYAKHIGKEFDVIKHTDHGYEVDTREPGDEPYTRYYVSESDCVLVDAEVTVLPDESLGAVLREYREVKRKARVGETVKYVWPGEPDHFDVVTDVSANGDVEFYPYEDGEDNEEVIGYSADAYVVLEPTEILVIDYERFRMIDRKAAVGERVIVTEVAPDYLYAVGDVGTVLDDLDHTGAPSVRFANGDDYYVGKTNSKGGAKYAVLEPVASAEPTQELSAKPAEDQYAENIATLTLRVTGLEAKVDELAAQVAALTKTSSVVTRPASDAEIHAAVSSLRERKSPQQQLRPSRDEIVERAKADVKTLSKTHWNGSGDTVYAKGVYLHRADFVVNHEKRTVACLLRLYIGERVVARGVARCAPGETFNSHIGRAIALRRALGLTVPAEYLDAPQPEEVRAGDVVQLRDGSLYTCRYPHSLPLPDGEFFADDSRESLAGPALKGEAA